VSLEGVALRAAVSPVFSREDSAKKILLSYAASYEQAGILTRFFAFIGFGVEGQLKHALIALALPRSLPLVTRPPREAFYHFPSRRAVQ